MKWLQGHPAGAGQSPFHRRPLAQPVWRVAGFRARNPFLCSLFVQLVWGSVSCPDLVDGASAMPRSTCGGEAGIAEAWHLVLPSE